MEAVHDLWAQLDDFVCVTWASGSALQDVVRVFGVRDDAAQAPDVTVADEHGTHVTYAISGRITRAFDAEDVGGEETGEDSEMRDIQEWSRGLGVDVRDWAAIRSPRPSSWLRPSRERQSMTPGWLVTG